MRKEPLKVESDESIGGNDHDSAGESRGSAVRSIRTSPSVRWQTALGPYDDVRIVALVDFIAIDLRLKAPTHPEAITKLGPEGTSYRREIMLPGHVTKELAIAIQDPTPEVYREVIRKISDRFPFEKEPRVSELEISMDFWLPDPTLDNLGEVATRLFHFAKDKPEKQRLVTGKRPPRNVQDFGTLTDVTKAMQTGDFTIYAGFGIDGKAKPRSPISQRYYVKRTDGKAMLPRDQWRARMENTFFGSGLPFTTLDEADTFRFEGLAKHFKFWRVPCDADLTLGQRKLFSVIPGINIPPRHVRRPPGLPRIDRRSQRVLFADDLGRRTDGALRALSRRWARAL